MQLTCSRIAADLQQLMQLTCSRPAPHLQLKCSWWTAIDEYIYIQVMVTFYAILTNYNLNTNSLPHLVIALLSWHTYLCWALHPTDTRISVEPYTQVTHVQPYTQVADVPLLSPTPKWHTYLCWPLHPSGTCTYLCWPLPCGMLAVYQNDLIFFSIWRMNGRMYEAIFTAG